MFPRIVNWAAGLLVATTVGCSSQVDRESAEGQSSGASGSQANSQFALPPDDGNLSPQELAARVQFLAQNQRIDEAVTLLDKYASPADAPLPVLQMATEIIQARAMQIMSEKDTQSATPLLLRSAKYGRRVMANQPPEGRTRMVLASVFYNEACALALTDQGVEKAMESLKASFDLGFNDIGLLRTDKDLASLRENEEFNKFVDAMIESVFDNFESFDFTFALEDVKGNSIALDAYKGKVVIVDFWGTGCPPCREEIPHFVELQEKYRDQGLQVVGLNYEQVGPKQAPDTIRKFMASNAMNYPCAVGDAGTQDQVPGLDSYPTTLFIDRSGKVRMKLVGLQSMETLETIALSLLDEDA